jgi:hypothetical protein
VLFELINPSDPYTFEAESIEIAGVVTVILSSSFGAKSLDPPYESTPILFGWDAWLADRGIDNEFLSTNAEAIARAFESFIIGSASDRRELELVLKELPVERRESFIRERQERMRSSFNQIGERAYMLAKQFQKMNDRCAVEGEVAK